MLVRIRHYLRLAAVADHVRTPVADRVRTPAAGRVRTPAADNTAHSRTPECVSRGLECRNRTQGPASAKVAGSPPAARTRLSDRYCSRGCSGPQHIRSGDQREGQARPLTPSGSGFPFHHRIDHHVWLGPMGYTEGNQVLGDGSMVDYTQA